MLSILDHLASNGNPQNPNSLHYIDPSGRLNSYQQVRLTTNHVSIQLKYRRNMKRSHKNIIKLDCQTQTQSDQEQKKIKNSWLL